MHPPQAHSYQENVYEPIVLTDQVMPTGNAFERLITAILNDEESGNQGDEGDRRQSDHYGARVDNRCGRRGADGPKIR